MGPKMETWIQVHIECNGHYLQIENQETGKTRSCNVMDILLQPPVELQNIEHTIWQSWKNTSTILQICQLSHSLIEDEYLTHVHSHL